MVVEIPNGLLAVLVYSDERGPADLKNRLGLLADGGQGVYHGIRWMVGLAAAEHNGVCVYRVPKGAHALEGAMVLGRPLVPNQQNALVEAVGGRARSSVVDSEEVVHSDLNSQCMAGAVELMVAQLAQELEEEQRRAPSMWICDVPKADAQS